MGYRLRLIVPVAVFFAVAATPAAGGVPQARTAAQQHAEAALEEVVDLRHGRGVRSGRELTEALRQLSLNVRHLRGDDRAKAAQQLDRPDVVGPTVCEGEFCVHGTPLGDLNAILVLDEAQKVHDLETGTLGWREPPSDGDGRVDIYLDDVGADRLFGYAQTDGGDTQSQSSFLVIDNDFSEAQFGDIPALASLRVTLAHEYGHVLQYGYDVTADGWHYESSAVWLEHRLYPELDDWLRYVLDGSSGPGWGALTELPLTAYDDGRDQPRNAKPYGSVVWNHFLTALYGDTVQRRTWELSDGLSAPSTRAYDLAIKGAAGNGIGGDFAVFAAAVAEWRRSDSGFPRAAQLPDVERRGSLAADGPTATTAMDHLTFALYDVPDTSAGRIRLAASFPAGMHGALALVAREGSAEGGQVTTKLLELPSGGVGGVTLDQPHEVLEGGGRITAVLVNADTGQSGYDSEAGDWAWAHDSEQVAAAVTTDLSGPGISSRSPGPGATRVSTRRPVRVTFSKPVSGVDDKSLSLRGPNGKAVPAAVSYARSSRTATLTPASRLADTTRYTVRLTSAILDDSATSLPRTEWSFTTVTTAPRARLKVVSRTREAVRFRLRSTDPDRLRWVAKLVSRGDTVARKRGALRPGATRFVTVPAKGRAHARLVVELRDPQANRNRIARAL